MTGTNIQENMKQIKLNQRRFPQDFESHRNYLQALTWNLENRYIVLFQGNYYSLSTDEFEELKRVPKITFRYRDLEKEAIHG